MDIVLFGIVIIFYTREAVSDLYVLHNILETWELASTRSRCSMPQRYSSTREPAMVIASAHWTKKDQLDIKSNGMFISTLGYDRYAGSGSLSNGSLTSCVKTSIARVKYGRTSLISIDPKFVNYINSFRTRKMHESDNCLLTLISTWSIASSPNLLFAWRASRRSFSNVLIFSGLCRSSDALLSHQLWLDDCRRGGHSHV